MHIAIDARIVNSSTGRYVERLLTYLEDIDTENQYSILVREKDKGYWKPKNPNFSIVVAEFDQFSFAEQIGFNTLLRKLKPDLVHFGIIQQPILYRGKKVTTVHDLTLVKTYNSDKNWFIYHAKQLVGRVVFRIIAWTNDHLIAISEYTKKDLVEYTHIKPEKVTVTYESSDVGDSAPQPLDIPYSSYLLYVGQQSDYKNIKRLGDAHQKLLQTYPDLGLILVGSKNASALKNEQYFVKKGYKNILFTGFIPDEQLAWLYQQPGAHYVFPSLMEGFGLPGLEAMQNGAPVISSNATCLPEVYGTAAHYFNPTSIDNMVASINDVLSDPALREKLVKQGYEQVKLYSWKRMAAQTHSVYMNVLKQTKN